MASRILLFLCLLFPLGAEAQNWSADPGCSRDLTANTVRSGLFGWYCFTSLTDSAMLKNESVGAALCFDPNIATVGVSVAQGYVRVCHGNTITPNECQKLLVDLDGGGITPSDDLPLNGDTGETSRQRACIYGIPKGNIYFDVTVAPAAGTTARVYVVGN